MGCADAHQRSLGEGAPAFLSKWKIRKRKQLEDPLIALRQMVRKKTRDLIKSGVLQRGEKEAGKALGLAATGHAGRGDCGASCTLSLNGHVLRRPPGRRSGVPFS